MFRNKWEPVWKKKPLDDGISGKNRLTDTRIDQTTTYCGNAIIEEISIIWRALGKLSGLFIFTIGRPTRMPLILSVTSSGVNIFKRKIKRNSNMKAAFQWQLWMLFALSSKL